MMTWLGWTAVVLYVIALVHNLVRIGQGGYVMEWTPGLLIFTTILQVIMLVLILTVGTGFGL